MRLELEPHEIRALGAIVAEELLRSLAPRLDLLLSPLVQRALPPAGPTSQSSMTSTPPPPESALMNRREVMALTGLGSTTIWRHEGTGGFPARVQLSPGRVGWRRSEVMAWIASRG